MQHRLAAVKERRLDAHAFRRQALHVLDEAAADVLGLLVGDEPHRHLGAAPGRQHGLGAAALVAAEDAVDVERRPHRGALERREVALAVEGSNAEVAAVGLLVEGQRGDLAALPLLQRAHGVIEAGDGDAARRRVFERGEDAGQGVQRIDDDTAVGAGVEVAVGPVHLHLHVGDAAQAVDDGGLPRPLHRRVRHHDAVAGEAAAGVLGDVAIDGGAARLLLPLDEELDVDRQRAAGLEDGLDRLQVRVGLPFVVGGAAGDQVVALAGGLEGRVAPLLDRVHRLHVVMAVEEDRRLAGRAQPLAVDERMAAGVDALGGETGVTHALEQPVAGSVDLGLVGRIGGDRGDSQEVLELAEVPLLVTLHPLEHVAAPLCHFPPAHARVRRAGREVYQPANGRHRRRVVGGAPTSTAERRLRDRRGCRRRGAVAAARR